MFFPIASSQCKRLFASWRIVDSHGSPLLLILGWPVAVTLLGDPLFGFPLAAGGARVLLPKLADPYQ